MFGIWGVCVGGGWVGGGILSGTIKYGGEYEHKKQQNTVITIVILFSPSMIVCTCITKQPITYQDFNFIPIQLIVKPTRT